MKKHLFLASRWIGASGISVRLGSAIFLTIADILVPFAVHACEQSDHLAAVARRLDQAAGRIPTRSREPRN
jgi:hypothetical protein